MAEYAYEVAKAVRETVLGHIGSIAEHSEVVSCPACERVAQVIALGHRADRRAWDEFLRAYWSSATGVDARNAYVRYYLHQTERDPFTFVAKHPCSNV